MNDQTYHSGWILTNHSCSTENVPMVWYWTVERKQSNDDYIPDKSGGRKSTFCLEEPFLKDNEASLHRWCFFAQKCLSEQTWHGMQPCKVSESYHSLTRSFYWGPCLFREFKRGHPFDDVWSLPKIEVTSIQQFWQQMLSDGPAHLWTSRSFLFFFHSQTLLLKQVFTQLKFRIQNPLRITKIHLKIRWASSFRISNISYCTIKYSTSYNNKNYPPTHKKCKNLCAGGGDWF